MGLNVKKQFILVCIKVFDGFDLFEAYDFIQFGSVERFLELYEPIAKNIGLHIGPVKIISESELDDLCIGGVFCNV